MSSICKQSVRMASALAVVVIASAPASAQLRHSEAETAGEINAANKLLRDGKVDEALEAFRRVVPGDQQRDELNYNMAVAEYRKGNTDAAEKLFSEVAGTTTPAVASNSRYNLGNCQYAKALQVAEQDKPAAIKRLHDAISHYRGALRGNSNNADARANIELAGELIRKLEQEQKQQDEQKNQDQEQPPQDDKQPQDDQKNEDQQNQKDQSGQKSDQQKNDGEKNEMPGDEQQKSDDQKSPGEESQADQPKPSEQQQQQPKGSDNKQNQPQNRQQKSGDQQQPNEDAAPEEQEEKNQPVPAGDLKAAGQQDENKKSDDSEAIAEPNVKDGLMTREEALKMLQSVRDRDMLRRMQQQRRERSRHVPVDRDW
ncbi:MAG: hypothetical protein H7Z17_20270 [Fuerstia sp.]|nr:hypothetical protein [Fuerstiella sp.]